MSDFFFDVLTDFVGDIVEALVDALPLPHRQEEARRQASQEPHPAPDEGQ